MVIEKYISKLLFEHDCVIVPGLGGFIANYTPAGIHPVHHTFSPPSRQLAFNASLSNNDGLLADAIRSGLGISFSEAAGLIATEVEAILQKLGKHEKVTLERIGTLSFNKEKRLQFNPDHSFNHHPDSFGLTVFTSAPIKRESLHEKISRRLIPQHAVRSGRRLPASLKWAAVVVPLMAIGIWTAFNTGRISSFYNNYASLIPSSGHHSGPEGANEKRTAAATKVISALPAETSPAINDAPVNPEKVVIEATAPDTYFIIAGAFSVEENARKFSEDLRAKGFDSFIAGQNRRGLYRVSIEGFSDKTTAMHKINEYRNGEFPGAWLLSME